eukprot:542673-Prymnesium_polylepis.1
MCDVTKSSILEAHTRVYMSYETYLESARVRSVVLALALAPFVLPLGSWSCFSSHFGLFAQRLTQSWLFIH